MTNIQRYCVYCGTKLREKAKFCEGCGKKPFSVVDIKETMREELKNEIRKEIKEEQKKEISKERKIIDIILIIAICIALIVIIGRILGIY